MRFSSVESGSYLTAGPTYKRIVIESAGMPVFILTDTTTFTPEANVDYDLYFQFSPARTQDWQTSYGIKAFGNMTVEVSDPYLFNDQIQNICAETYDGEKFTGAIPFSGSVTLLDYMLGNIGTLTNLRIPLYAIKTVGNNLQMWNGSVWKQINNS